MDFLGVPAAAEGVGYDPKEDHCCQDFVLAVSFPEGNRLLDYLAVDHHYLVEVRGLLAEAQLLAGAGNPFVDILVHHIAFALDLLVVVDGSEGKARQFVAG